MARSIEDPVPRAGVRIGAARSLARLAVRGALLHKLRFALPALAIAVGVALVSGSLVLASGAERGYQRLLRQVTAGTDVYVRGPENDIRQGISDFAPVPETVLEQLRSVPGVAAAQGQVVRLAELTDQRGTFLDTDRKVYGYSWPRVTRLSAFRLVQGRAPRLPGDVAVDKATAINNGLHVGSPVRASLDVLSPRPATVVGVVEPVEGGDLSTAAAVFVAPTWAQEMTGIGNSWDLLQLAASPGVAADQLRARVAAALPKNGTSAITSRQYADAEIDNLRRREGTVIGLLGGLSIVVLAMAALLILNTQLILLGQRTAELGLLRSLGMTRRQVRLAVFGEAAVVGVVASLVGALAGLPAAAGLRQLLVSAGEPVASGPIDVDPRAVLAAAVLGIALSVVIAIAPATRSLRAGPSGTTPPITPTTPGRRLRRLVATSLGSAVLAIGKRLGAPGRVAAVAFMGDLRRATPTLIALAAALAAIVGAATVTQSAATSIIRLVERTDRADLVVVSDTGPGIDYEAVDKLREAPALGTVSKVGSESFTVGGHDDYVTAVELQNLSSVLALPTVSGSLQGFSDGAIAVTQSTAVSGGYRVGDFVQVRFGTPQVRSLRITAVILDNGITRNWIIPFVTYERGYFLATIRSVFLKAVPGTSPLRLRSQVSAGVAGFPGVQVLEPTAFAAQQTAAVKRPLTLVYAIVGLAVVLGLLGVANMMALMFVERERELGLMRVLGMTRRQLLLCVECETTSLIAVGVAAGVAVGLLAGVAATLALTTQGIDQIVLPGGTLAIAVLLTTLLALVATAPIALRVGAAAQARAAAGH